jgi:hypothetical protein
MKRFIAFAAITLTSINALAVPELSQALEIKGISIGMPEPQVENIIRPEEIFTVGGVRSKDQRVYRDYVEGKLDNLVFTFSPSSFDEVYHAVKEKYPSIECVESSVSNAMGATFKQMECRIYDADSMLKLFRMIDTTTSALVLVSKKRLEESSRSKEHNKKDI